MKHDFNDHLATSPNLFREFSYFLVRRDPPLVMNRFIA
jgi:hypothetical protein